MRNGKLNMVNGLKHKRKEYKPKKESPIQENCSCGSGSFLMRKKNGNEKWFCRKCGAEIELGEDM